MKNDINSPWWAIKISTWGTPLRGLSCISVWIFIKNAENEGETNSNVVERWLCDNDNDDYINITLLNLIQ